MSVTLDSYCNNKIENITGSNNLPIKYFNHSADISNEELSELILCNADNSHIKNISINASQSKNNNGIFILRTDNSNFTDIVSSNNCYGIYSRGSSNNTITNVTVNDNPYGISLRSSLDNTVTDSIIKDNNNGIYIYSSENNLIYNNFFNNTNNAYFAGTIYKNHWNTTNRAGTNIIGGPYTGGNFWATSSNDGFSQTCSGAGNDGICDSPYTLTVNNTDYMPLTIITSSSSSSYNITIYPGWNLISIPLDF